MLCFCFGERGLACGLFDFQLSRLAGIQHVGVRGTGWESKIFFRVARSVSPLLGSLTAELQVAFSPVPPPTYDSGLGRSCKSEDFPMTEKEVRPDGSTSSQL